MVDTRDLKSLGPLDRAGSSPASGIDSCMNPRKLNQTYDKPSVKSSFRYLRENFITFGFTRFSKSL